MKNLGYYNGKYDELEKMSVSMLDRAFYFGDGVYDVMYSKNYIIYAEDEHIERFFDSAAKIGIRPKESKDEIRALLRSLIRKVDDDEQLIYIQASRGTDLRIHTYRDDCEPNLTIMLRPARIRDTYEKVKAITLPDRRYAYCNIKSLSLLPNVLYAKETERAGCYEAILHRDGRVTECAHSNVSILKDGVFYTAPADEYILAGTARAHLIRMCKRFMIPVREEPYSLEMLRAADEILISSSSAFCLSVCELDGMPVGGRAPTLLRTLQDALTEEFLLETAL